MKNTTTNYTINAAAKEIEITKKFEKAASVYNSNEYKQLVALMNDLPTFTIKVKEIKKKAGKKSYKGLTINEMRRFVSTRSEKELFVFEKVLEVAKHKNGSYAITKKWFLNKYKEAYEAELEAYGIEKELEELAGVLSPEEMEEEEAA